jgi:hypothetical protein
VDFISPVSYGEAMFQVALKEFRSAAKTRSRVLQQQMDEVGHVVYFVQFGPYVKIGHTGRLHSRLKQLKRSPKDLLAIVPGDWHTEQEFHRRFASARIYAELFRWSPDLLAYVNGLREAAGVGVFTPRPEGT